MMYLENLILTVKDEDGVFMNRHFNAVYVKIDSTKMMIANTRGSKTVYNLDDVMYMQAQGYPRQFIIFQ